MTLDEIIRARHSVRAYDTSRPVPIEHIHAICEAARLAPSASNTQPWRFIAVTERPLLDRIATEGMEKRVINRFLAQAPLIIVGCSKIDLITNKIFGKIVDTPYYLIDMGIGLEHLVLKATELGLGTCWIGWFNEEKVKEILNIPPYVRVHVMITLGYPADPADMTGPHKRKPLERLLFMNAWGERAEI